MRARARNQSVLDFVKGDITTFRSRINSNDRAHLDAYLDSLQGVEQKVHVGLERSRRENLALERVRAQRCALARNGIAAK